MKFTIALSALAATAMAAPAILERDDSTASAEQLASNLPAVQADTESGKTITFIQLEDGVLDPATGEFIAKDAVVQAAHESGVEGTEEEKRTLLLGLGLLTGAFRNRWFGGYHVTNVHHVHNHYNRWSHGPWDVRPHDWCNSCVSFSGHRGGYNVIDTRRRVRVWGPTNRYWHRW